MREEEAQSADLKKENVARLDFTLLVGAVAG